MKSFAMKCPSCGAALSVDDQFCTECGTAASAPSDAPAASRFCIECGTRCETGVRFCTECGALTDAPAAADVPAQPSAAARQMAQSVSPASTRQGLAPATAQRTTQKPPSLPSAGSVVGKRQSPELSRVEAPRSVGDTPTSRAVPVAALSEPSAQPGRAKVLASVVSLLVIFGGGAAYFLSGEKASTRQRT